MSPLNVSFDQKSLIHSTSHPTWPTLGYIGLPWATLDYLGLPWATLGYLGLPWATLGYIGRPWVILGFLKTYTALGVPLHCLMFFWKILIFHRFFFWKAERQLLVLLYHDQAMLY
jgi:hypothetical protein